MSAAACLDIGGFFIVKVTSSLIMPMRSILASDPSPAARLQALAVVGGVSVSESVRSAVKEQERFPLSDYAIA